MKCFRAPPPPTVLYPLVTAATAQPPIRHSRNPITWQNCTSVPVPSKARISPVLTDTLYFAERPRGLGRAKFSLLSRSSFELGDSAALSASRRRKMDSPPGTTERRRSKRRFQWRKERNPILQDDPSFLPKSQQKPIWKPSDFVKGENWKRSGGTTDLWVSHPVTPKHSPGSSRPSRR